MVDNNKQTKAKKKTKVGKGRMKYCDAQLIASILSGELMIPAWNEEYNVILISRWSLFDFHEEA